LHKVEIMTLRTRRSSNIVLVKYINDSTIMKDCKSSFLLPEIVARVYLREATRALARILSVVQSTKFPLYQPCYPELTHGNPML